MTSRLQTDRAVADSPGWEPGRTLPRQADRRGPRRSPRAGGFAALARAVSWHRRLIGAVLVALAVLSVLQVLRPTAAAAVAVVVARADLPAGTRLSSADLRLALLPPGAVPRGSATSPAALVGALLASPVRDGEPVTDIRLVGPALVDSYRATLGADAGEVAIRVSDASGAALVRAGDRIDVLAAPTAGATAGGPAVTVAVDLPVLAVPGAASAPAGGSGALGGIGGTGSTGAADGAGAAGVLIVVATPATARLLAQAEVSSQISVLVHPG